MATPLWQPGTIYAPGALVQPASALAPVASPVVNGGFESGDTAWTKDAGWTIGQYGAGTHFQGTWSAQWDATSTGRIRATAAFDVQPGQSITASCQVQQGSSSSGDAGGRVEIGWYTAADALVSYSSGNMIDTGSDQHWKQSTVTAVAPPTAAKARIVGYAFRTAGGAELWVDNFTWNLQVTELPAGLVFKATQAVAGYSDAVEPVWPVIVGGTVVDNEVTWEGVIASRVVWEATPILVSGATEPDFPDLADATVADGTILWTAMRANVVQAPNSRVVQIAVSKIFAADGDITPFSATVNCLDWTTPNDAGYIPNGLNTYGGTDTTALGLYRSNLVIFNEQGYQMWQVDQDPANMAFLDASPIPCSYPDSVQPVANDLALLTSLGVRSIGIAGASTNLQAGYFGHAVDPLVRVKIRENLYEPFGVSYPGAGQYWLVFGDEVFVLTVIGKTSDASWSRYVFPFPIENWTISGGDLFLRTTLEDDSSVVWRVSQDALADDVVCSPEAPVLSGELDELTAELTWEMTEDNGNVVDFFRLYDADTDTVITETTDFSFDDEDLAVSGTYRYYVTAVGTNGGESEPSNVVTLSTVVPSAPSLSGDLEDIGGAFTAHLTWTVSTPAYAVTGYRLYDASDDSLIVQQSGLTYDDTPIPLSTTKSYYVRAYGPGGGVSPISNILTLNTGDASIIIEVFTSSAAWSKHPDLVYADVSAVAGGGGAGSGSVIGGASVTLGGQGGGGGEYRTVTLLAAALGATESVTVGQGGAGGAARLGDINRDGITGATGGQSSFGIHLVANGGEGGAGGRNGDSNRGDGGTGGSGGTGEPGGDGGPPGRSEPSDPGGSTTHAGPGGGGGGGRLTASSIGGTGGSGGTSLTAAGGPGGDAGTASVPAEDGTAGDSATDDLGGGGGGGGGCGPRFGAATVNFDAGDGATGGVYGSGGGGGGATNRGTPGVVPLSGAGGNGTPGVVIVVSHITV